MAGEITALALREEARPGALVQLPCDDEQEERGEDGGAGPGDGEGLGKGAGVHEQVTGGVEEAVRHHAGGNRAGAPGDETQQQRREHDADEVGAKRFVRR